MFNGESGFGLAQAVTTDAHSGASQCMGMVLAGITEEERQAHLMRERDGLTDDQAARQLGVRRETVCRRRLRFERKIQKLRITCTGEQCPVIEKLTT